jgi:glutamine synthetase
MLKSSADEILLRLREDNVQFLRLQFIDINGANKNVEVPAGQFEKALAGDILFDGSSIEGFTRIEESDMLLKPDLDTYAVFPWEEHSYGKVARLICDVAGPDGNEFDGCPRTVLKRVVAKCEAMGYRAVIGPEAEFFLFELDETGSPSTQTHDAGGYFDLTPVDRGEQCRRDIVETLTSIGFEVEAAHHEVAPGQHEIDFQYDEALVCADRLTTFKMVVRKIAQDHELHATFMPKPIFGENGSGMHCHQSLFYTDPEKGRPGSRGNAFYDPNAPMELSRTARYFIGGLMDHARGICAVTNPIVNSYKRLVPGFEAPVQVAWSARNRSPLARIPARRGIGTRVELRMPDPACNPYLAFAVMIAAGLDGIENQRDPGEPTNENVWEMSPQEKRKRGISELPGDLHQALVALEEDAVVMAALGEHVAQRFLQLKRAEWTDYISQVHDWELENYLSRY